MSSRVHSTVNVQKGDVFDQVKNPSLKTSLALQRSLFQQAKCIGDDSLMRVAIENIKSDVKGIALKLGYDKNILYAERVIQWYDTLSERYEKRTPNGLQVILPKNIGLKINKLLTQAYEKLMQIQYDAELT